MTYLIDIINTDDTPNILNTLTLSYMNTTQHTAPSFNYEAAYARSKHEATYALGRWKWSEQQTFILREISKHGYFEATLGMMKAARLVPDNFTVQWDQNNYQWTADFCARSHRVKKNLHLVAL